MPLEYYLVCLHCWYVWDNINQGNDSSYSLKKYVIVCVNYILLAYLTISSSLQWFSFEKGNCSAWISESMPTHSGIGGGVGSHTSSILVGGNTHSWHRPNLACPLIPIAFIKVFFSAWQTNPHAQWLQNYKFSLFACLFVCLFLYM